MKIKNVEIDEVKDEPVVHCEIEYPRNNELNTISVGLMDVRASDDIRIKFDFDRDGWVIYQPRTYHPHIEGNSYGCEVEWIESAFCPAWQFELDEEDQFTYQPKKEEQSPEDDDSFLNKTFRYKYTWIKGREEK